MDPHRPITGLGVTVPPSVRDCGEKEGTLNQRKEKIAVQTESGDARAKSVGPELKRKKKGQGGDGGGGARDLAGGEVVGSGSEGGERALEREGVGIAGGGDGSGRGGGK